MKPLAYGHLVLALSAMVAFAGCAAKTNEVTVSGNVTIDGEPIAKGTISFVATDGATPTAGGVIKDGTYSAVMVPGDKVVMVLGNKLVGQEPEYKDVPDSPMRDKYEMITPEAYNAKHLTPLKATVTESQEGLNFELTKDLKTK